MMVEVGDVFTLVLGFQGKTRPVVIVSREDANAPRALSVFVPLTKESRGGKYEVIRPRVPWLKLRSYANVLGMGAAGWHELTDRRGRFDTITVAKIKDSIWWMLDLWPGNAGIKVPKAPGIAPSSPANPARPRSKLSRAAEQAEN